MKLVVLFLLISNCLSLDLFEEPLTDIEEPATNSKCWQSGPNESDDLCGSGAGSSSLEVRTMKSRDQVINLDQILGDALMIGDHETESSLISVTDDLEYSLSGFIDDAFQTVTGVSRRQWYRMDMCQKVDVFSAGLSDEGGSCAAEAIAFNLGGAKAKKFFHFFKASLEAMNVFCRFDKEICPGCPDWYDIIDRLNTIWKSDKCSCQSVSGCLTDFVTCQASFRGFGCQIKYNKISEMNSCSRSLFREVYSIWNQYKTAFDKYLKNVWMSISKIVRVASSSAGKSTPSSGTSLSKNLRKKASSAVTSCFKGMIQKKVIDPINEAIHKMMCFCFSSTRHKDNGHDEVELFYNHAEVWDELLDLERRIRKNLGDAQVLIMEAIGCIAGKLQLQVTETLLNAAKSAVCKAANAALGSCLLLMLGQCAFKHRRG